MRDIDIQIAQALGWTGIIVSDETGRIRTPLDEWRQQHPDAMPIWLTGRSPEVPDWPSSVVPHYEDDTDWLEDEIERRGLGWEYAQALLRIVAYPNGMNLYDRKPRGSAFYQETQPTDADLFPLIRATSELRVQAFLQVIQP